jgi:hypothetical protein
MASRHDPNNRSCTFYDGPDLVRASSPDSDFCSCPRDPNERCKRCGHKFVDHLDNKCPVEEPPWNAKERWIIDQIWNGDPDEKAWRIRQKANHLFPHLKTRYETEDDDD